MLTYFNAYSVFKWWKMQRLFPVKLMFWGYINKIKAKDLISK